MLDREPHGISFYGIIKVNKLMEIKKKVRNIIKQIIFKNMRTYFIVKEVFSCIIIIPLIKR